MTPKLTWVVCVSMVALALASDHREDSLYFVFFQKNVVLSFLNLTPWFGYKKMGRLKPAAI